MPRTEVLAWGHYYDYICLVCPVPFQNPNFTCHDCRTCRCRTSLSRLISRPSASSPGCLFQSPPTPPPSHLCPKPGPTRLLSPSSIQSPNPIHSLIPPLPPPHPHHSRSSRLSASESPRSTMASASRTNCIRPPKWGDSVSSTYSAVRTASRSRKLSDSLLLSLVRSWRSNEGK